MNDVKKSLDQSLAAIEALDLSPILFKATHPKGDTRWPEDYALYLAAEYKKYLTLLVKYPEQTIAPTVEVDEFWHLHILDTRKYAEDCENVFGYFLHHFPYFGLRSEEDEQDLHQAGNKWHELYAQEFGARVPAAEASAPAWCFKADEKKASWCSAAVEAKQSAAWCFAASKQKQSAAWCFASTDASRPAWCFAAAEKQRPAWCFAAADTQKAAWCFAASETKQPAWCFAAATPEKQRAAWCFAASDNTQKAAWCFAAKEAKQPAWCFAAVEAKQPAWCFAAVEAKQPAWCFANSGAEAKKAAWCFAAVDAKQPAWCFANSGTEAKKAAWCFAAVEAKQPAWCFANAEGNADWSYKATKAMPALV